MVEHFTCILKADWGNDVKLNTYNKFLVVAVVLYVCMCNVIMLHIDQIILLYIYALRHFKYNFHKFLAVCMFY